MNWTMFLIGLFLKDDSYIFFDWSNSERWHEQCFWLVYFYRKEELEEDEEATDDESDVRNLM